MILIIISCDNIFIFINNNITDILSDILLSSFSSFDFCSMRIELLRKCHLQNPIIFSLRMQFRASIKEMQSFLQD